MRKMGNNAQKMRVDSGCCIFATATYGGRNMTVQELYEYAKQHGVLDYEIRVQYRDDGGEYQGTDAFLYLSAEKEEKVLVL